MLEGVIAHFDNFNFNKLCDIGGGNGHKAKILADKFGSKVWIIEGDARNNNLKINPIKAKWNADAANFAHYWIKEKLVEKQKIIFKDTEYHLIDADNLDLDNSIKFDLITSFMSCGFHYPLNTYYEFIKKHSHNDTKYIFDIRIRKYKNSDFVKILLPPEVKILKTIYECDKYHTCELKFNL